MDPVILHGINIAPIGLNQSNVKGHKHVPTRRSLCKLGHFIISIVELPQFPQRIVLPRPILLYR